MSDTIIDLEKRRPDNSAKKAAKDLAPALSEDFIAEEFVVRHVGLARFNHTSNEWLLWDDARWRPDNTQCAFDWVRSLAREMASNAPSQEHRRIGSRRFAEGVEAFARADQRLATTFEHWDQDPDLLGTPDGIVDLKTGELFPPDPAAFITRSTTTVPDFATECPRFFQFLNETTGRDATLKDFLQQWIGYCLTGHTREQKLLFIHGPGGSGKSTLASTIGAIMGSYAGTANISTFTNNRFDGHPEQLARLDGLRLVVSSETEAGHRWRENRIKELTGSDMITARYMRQNSFEFKPKAKFVFIGNHAPAITNLDTAMMRRILMVPFTMVPAEVDQHLAEILEKEAPGILRWAIQGAVDWYTKGLVIPKAVSEATTKYFDEQDVFRQWLEASCVVDHARRICAKTAELFESWSTFAKKHGEEPGTHRTFNETLRHRGLESKQIKELGTKGCFGIQLKSNWENI